MVSVLELSLVDPGFDPRFGQTNDNKLIVIDSPLSMQHKEVRAMIVWLGNRIMCPSEEICVSTDCCYSNLAL